ncbi:Calx-beta domain-containing protein [Allomuricauda sp. d1]|uniref:DUF7933 domain-containing protein n=1 Tax=Allomuricauda sp. d1 TaxID=3136725 RepID=UPI0031E38A54
MPSVTKQLTFLFFFFFCFLASAQETFLDNFSSVSYSNNDGSQNFSSNWTEQNDGGSPSGGRIRVNSNRLRFRNMDNRWIYRFVPLAGASSVTLTFDYDATSRGGEALDAYIYNSNTGSWDFVTRIQTNNTGTVTYNLTAAQIASNPAIIFYSGSGTASNSWDGSDTIFIDNVLFTATFGAQINVNDVTVDESAGTATFTATHSGANTSGFFTVNYTTQDGSATAGSDYSTNTGTLSFNGTSGDTDQITVSILNNAGVELDETFTIQLTGSSNSSIDISDTGTGTITEPNDPRPYEERYAMNLAGNFKVLSNTNLECVSGCPGSPTTNNPSVVMGYADIDGDGSTTNSSSATLSLPVGATVQWAGLYWGGLYGSTNAGITNPLGLDASQVKLRIPGSSSYNTVSASVINVENASFSGWTSYLAFADVTSLVQSGGSGDYFAADITLATGSSFTGPYGGWNMVVIYQDASEKSRNIAVWDGFDFFGFGANDSFTVTGLLTPSSGAFETHAAYFAFDGEANSTGDFVSIEGTALSNALNPADNTLNGTISEFGLDTGARNPNYSYSWGIDSDVFDASGFVANNATDMDVTLGSSSEGIWGGVFVTSNEIAFPSVASISFNPSIINLGDESIVTISIDNPSNGVSLSNFSLTNNLPSGMTIAPTPDASSNCGGTISAVSGSSTFSISGVSIPAGTSCTFVFDVVTGTDGSFTNTITSSDVSNTQNIPLSGSASSTLTVLALTDFDNDGVPDSSDLDDDNDGILDEVESVNCDISDPTIDVTIFSEDFGVADGNRNSTPYTNYIYEDGTGSGGGSPNLNDGEYTIFDDISTTGTWAPTVWQSVGDHTTGNDKMLIVNANNTAGLEFYRRPLVQAVENVPLDISFWVMNLDIDSPSNDGRTEPDITVIIEQGGSQVFSFNTGSVPREADGDPTAWKQFTGSFTPTSNTALEIVMINNAPGGLGNDLALDDIQVTQSFCDSDGDGTPNSQEADSDGDGCNDADEAYGDANADSDDNGMYGSGTPSVNSDGTVTAASYQTPEDGDASGTFDFLEAGTAPTITSQPTDSSICPGGNTSFTVSASNADTYQWQLFNGTGWDDLTDTGIHSGSNTVTLNIANAQTSDNGNRYRVIVSNSSYICDTETSSEVELTVIAPTANAGADQEICDGESVTLTASGSGGNPAYTYLWSTGETTASITVTPTGNPNSNVNVDYTVTVTDQNGCQDTDTVRVRVESNPTVTVSTTDATCSLDNGEITFTFPDHPNRSAIEFSLDNQASYEPNVPDNSGSVTYNGLAAGTYDLWARWGNNECPISLGSFTIANVPEVTINTQPADQTVFVGDNATFSVNASNADTYQWQVSTNGGGAFNNIADGTDYSGTQTATVTVNNVVQIKSGYLYRVIVSNSTTSCTSTTSNAAILTVNVRTVITNRRVTYRVNRD